MELTKKYQLNQFYFNLTGPDGSGKSTIIDSIPHFFSNYVHLREPGGNEVAEIIRNTILCIDDKERMENFNLLLNSNLLPLTKKYVKEALVLFGKFNCTEEMDTKSLGIMEAYLYAASRNETNNNLVIPTLNKGGSIIGSRSVACSMAYQGNARGLGYDFIWNLNKPTLTKLPDFEILLDIPTEIAMERISKRTEKQDRLDNESFDFHKKSREGYLTYYKTFCPYPFFIVDATGTEEENLKKVLDVIRKNII